jgi:BlaI family transcriptional regulator, penicillinase repressor
MAEKPLEILTPAEWKVMKIVWREKRCAARDVYAETKRLFGWAPSTAKTVLARLVDKGYLTTTQVGNSFLYRPARSALKTLMSAADALVDHLLEGTTGPVLAYLVKKSKLSPGELAELRALIDAQAKQTKSGINNTSSTTE